ncbi:hypothetical protein [Acinetobacter sp. YH16042]|uniref:hypothetical protein n=1 Tax=Acinetobacter sp. YH16042 TaxID=2601186 RepID=UPI0015D31C68|nr:hypothetical protein [Acinetobacter sp. YH16042]
MDNVIQHLKDFQTLYAALIGATGLILTFFFTALMTFRFHKSDKLAEQRLKIYLELTEKYIDFLVYLELTSQGVFLESIDQENEIMKKYKEILIIYNKFCLLSTSLTKKKSMGLMNELQKIYELAKKLDVKDQKEVFIFIQNLKAVEDEGIKFSWILRKELEVATDLKIEKELI